MKGREEEIVEKSVQDSSPHHVQTYSRDAEAKIKEGVKIFIEFQEARAVCVISLKCLSRLQCLCADIGAHLRVGGVNCNRISELERVDEYIYVRMYVCVCMCMYE